MRLYVRLYLVAGIVAYLCFAQLLETASFSTIAVELAQFGLYFAGFVVCLGTLLKSDDAIHPRRLESASLEERVRRLSFWHTVAFFGFFLTVCVAMFSISVLLSGVVKHQAPPNALLAIAIVTTVVGNIGTHVVLRRWVLA